MEKKREPPKIRVFPDLQRLTGYRAIALPHANEIHIDAKYYGTPLGDAIIEHEKRHIEYAFEVAESKHRNLTILKNNLWDIWDSMIINITEIRMKRLKTFIGKNKRQAKNSAQKYDSNE